VEFSIADIPNPLFPTLLQKRPQTGDAKTLFQLEPTFNVLASSEIQRGSRKAIVIVKQDSRSHVKLDPKASQR
jgi:hypothetical protein